MTKSPKYFYDADAIREKHKEPNRGKGEKDKVNWNTGGIIGRGRTGKYTDGIREYNPLGRNKRTVWTISTQSFPEAHFATFPEKLVIPCIKAGTSEKGNCPICGKPWVRVTERIGVNAKIPPNSKTAKKREMGLNTAITGAERDSPIITTLGWQPQCECESSVVMPPVVFDPFMGSGTVAVVCEHYNRGWIGIELSREYCDIAVERIKREVAQYKLELT